MKNRKGFILPAVILVFVLLMLIVPVMVKWVQNDTKLSVKDQKASIAFNLAEAALDRGYWKIKSSTSTCAAALAGTVIAGYNFDATYADVPGGTYRIKLSSGAAKCVTILAEGRDSSTKEVRAISAVFMNQTIYSPLITSGNLTYSKGFSSFWGPVMAQGNISMTEDVVAKRYFPRKFSKGVVTGHGSDLRDTNGLTPPNTDNVEWWSDYQYVPELPIPDFQVLKASAIATGTYNRYDSGIVKKFPNQPADDSGPNLVWYWDGDLDIKGFEGGGNCDHPGNWATNYGFKGTLIIRGNLTLDGAGCYKFSDPVPAQAYLDHYKLLENTYDTSAANEYPADDGYQVTRSTFNFGTETFTPYPGWGTAYNTVGERGFTYVGGTLTITNAGFMDFVGALWVVGSITATGASATRFCGLFFNDKLEVPTLNVILIRQSWQEVKPSAQAWP